MWDFKVIGLEGQVPNLNLGRNCTEKIKSVLKNPTPQFETCRS